MTVLSVVECDDLKRDGLVKRTQYDQIPPRAEYEATELSATLGPVLETIAAWVQTHALQRRTLTEPAGNEVGQPA